MSDAVKNTVYNFGRRNDPAPTVLEIGSLTIKEQLVGGTKWFGIRARGTEWSWITPDEAQEVGRYLATKSPGPTP